MGVEVVGVGLHTPKVLDMVVWVEVRVVVAAGLEYIQHLKCMLG